MPDRGPVFLAHQGAQSATLLEEFLDSMASDNSTWPVAATIFLPRYAPTTSADIVASFQSGARYVLADPETHRMLDPFSERGRGRHHLPYLQESDPRANRQRFVDGVLRAQVDAGADALISPWLTHGLVRATTNLRATLRFAELAADSPITDDYQLLFGIAVTEDVVADDDDRGGLIDDLVDLPDGNIYLRIQVTPPTSFGQYAQLPVLLGMREIARGLAANGRACDLPTDWARRLADARRWCVRLRFWYQRLVTAIRSADERLWSPAGVVLPSPTTGLRPSQRST